MHKHPSTIYRMRKRLGPLRFVVEGRRIYIDLQSLESFLSQQSPIESAARTRAADAEATPPVSVPEFNRGSYEKQQDTKSREQQQKQPDVPGRSGQRELIIHPRPSHMLFCYIA